MTIDAVGLFHQGVAALTQSSFDGSRDVEGKMVAQRRLPISEIVTVDVVMPSQAVKWSTDVRAWESHASAQPETAATAPNLINDERSTVPTARAHATHSVSETQLQEPHAALATHLPAHLRALLNKYRAGSAQS